MADIKILTTGGTIDKIYQSTKGTKELSFSKPTVTELFERLPDSPDYTVKQICAVDSLNMTDEHREKLLNEIHTSTCQNIVITHGTDTMIQTARYLQESSVPNAIVLTGASRPYHYKDSDASLNLGGALTAVKLLDSNVRISMHGDIYNPKNVVKTEDGSFERKNQILE